MVLHLSIKSRIASEIMENHTFAVLQAMGSQSLVIPTLSESCYSSSTVYVNREAQLYLEIDGTTSIDIHESTATSLEVCKVIITAKNRRKHVTVNQIQGRR